MSSIEYHFNVPLTGQEVADVFKRSGINRPTDDVERIQKMIDPIFDSTPATARVCRPYFALQHK